jgi:hypothetical protein
LITHQFKPEYTTVLSPFILLWLLETVTTLSIPVQDL